MEQNNAQLIIDTFKTVAESVGQTTKAIATIKEIKRTTGINKRQSNKIKLEANTDLEIAEMFKHWCESNPGYFYMSKIGNMHISNIGKILELAQKGFDDKDEIPKQALDKEWLLKFLDVSGQTSDEEKQKILAKVLCGQLKKPDSVSYRTLDLLKNLSKKDIELFKKVISYSLSFNNIVFIPRNERSNYIQCDEIFYLAECGLMDDSNLKMFTTNIVSAKFLTSNRNYVCVINKGKLEKIDIDCYFFTNCAVELINLLQVQECEIEHIKQCLLPNKNKYNISMFKTTGFEPNIINIINLDLMI